MNASVQEESVNGSLILVINAGSSSVRFATFERSVSLRRISSGKINRIGLINATFDFCDSKTGRIEKQAVNVANHQDATKFLIEWLNEKVGLKSIAAIGHRVVHGMHKSEPQLVTQALLHELGLIIPCDPQHLPGEIALIQAFHVRVPNIRQVVCFDTDFHSRMPRVAKLLSIPRRFDRKGIHRYGFHGLSYEFLIQELSRIGDSNTLRGRIILAHLGNGASLAAVRDGKSIDTTMGFTPASGLPMSTRSGDLDPGLVGYLARTEQMSVADFDQMINHDSGLLGVSETSSDMRDLIEKEADDSRAAEAIELFCYNAKKAIGSFVAVLGGLQTLVFTGGVGENSASVRYRICEGLNCLGINIDKDRNARNTDIISAWDSPVCVRVIRTDEEQVIASATSLLLGGTDE